MILIGIHIEQFQSIQVKLSQIFYRILSLLSISYRFQYTNTSIHTNRPKILRGQMKINYMLKN